MKYTTMVAFMFLVVMIFSSSVRIQSTLIENSTKPPCTTIELTGCQQAILFGDKPTMECCGTLRAQQLCFCDFIKNPSFTKYVSSPQARKILKACGIPYPQCN
ncbi:unnamed protein product [Cochlearia groenlandica]